MLPDQLESKKRKALGKGLAAILPTAPAAATESAERVVQVPVGQIDPNAVQPRMRFDKERLEGLAASIREEGVLQPLLVQRSGERYTLVVGERRLRACQIAGLETVPAIVREINADRLLEVTLVENIQREDLNPIEVASALQRLLDDLGLRHEDLSTRTGMSRTSITNYVRLLRLPMPVKRLVREGRLQMGHARALLALERSTDQESLATEAAARDWPVREVERRVKAIMEPPAKRDKPKINPNVADALHKLEERLQAPVMLRPRSARKGRIVITYSSPEQLMAIYDRIMAEPGPQP